MAEYPGVLMPRLGIADNDAEDLISYLEAQSARLDADQIRSRVPEAEIGGSFTLIDHHGKSVTDRDYLGKPTLVFFGFTSCPDICPTTLLELSNVLQELKSHADQLNVLFITVDPDRDTPQRLALYLSSFDHRIIGLSGTRENVAAAMTAYHVHAAEVRLEDGGYTMDHTATINMMDSKGKYVGTMSHQEAEASMGAKLRHLLESAHL